MECANASLQLCTCPLTEQRRRDQGNSRYLREGGGGGVTLRRMITVKGKGGGGGGGIKEVLKFFLCRDLLTL